MKELEQAIFKPSDLEYFYKNQLHHDRRIDIMCMPETYCLITNYPTGCSHCTPYDYDTHVPLVFYLKKQLEHKTIKQKVWSPQIPVTLAELLNISKPSATPFNSLPGIF